MTEKLTLVFKDGVRFIWKTTSIHDSRKVLKLQKKLGDPIDIIGDGKVAQLLREKYKVYNENPEAYKSDVFGTASKLSGVGKEEIQEKIGKVKRVFRR
jgi:hypothetical protein